MKDETQARGTTSIISDVLAHISNLIRKEIDLAKAEVSENISRAGIAIGLIAASLIIALVALNVLAGALVAGLTALGLEAGWSALIVGVTFAALALGMTLKGLKDLKMTSLAPTRTVKNLRRDADAVKETL
ncbi:phage holin family protein [Jannaschia pohangensis]|uniref:Putative Holin-X, holin superfamily III n=1 Tax=Jannaschia pohangensis TaxID=390807 RepID=A0A1I3TI49_9RHOB|nr:phage holin family protein [Jannaschia pohangensis]SFJ70089.1 Putative Holin-X, holin superfamily III [Jannaschia pohangensis]